MSSYLKLDLAGDGRTRGNVYGRGARKEIVANLKTYKARFDRGGIPWESARQRAAAFIPAMDSFDADLLQELVGISEGARVDLTDLVVLNARTCLSYNLNDECTSIALHTGSNGCAVMGQNWDNMVRLRPILLRVSAPHAPTVLTLTEAGTLAKIGCNESGIGVCVNGLSAPGTPQSGSIPLFVFLRKLLGAQRLADAKDLLLTCRRDAPHNFLVGSRADGAVDIETSYSRAELVAERAAGGVAHTNHVLAESLREKGQREPSQNSQERLRRAEELLKAQREGPASLERLHAMLSDHAGGPDAICRHRATLEGGFQIITKHAVMMDLRSNEMWVSDGPPCDAAVDTYRMDERLAVD